MTFKTIVTIGPAILADDKLKEIDAQGECIYRLNGSHIEEAEVGELADEIRKALPSAKIMLDLPGNKIRTANLSDPIRLVKGEVFFLHGYQINYPHFHEKLKKGDRILANDSIFTFEVIRKTSKGVKLLSHSEGLLLSNKGLHVRGIHKEMPFMFDKDKKLISKALQFGLDYVSLSFVRTSGDICEARKMITKHGPHIIAKVETRSAVENIDDILSEVDSVLVDRGDLSTEIDILHLADTQEKIISKALMAKKDIYLATQFLKNMETYPVPLISEVIDLCKTIRSGITGIQLSEETAIGRYPIDCVKLVFEAYRKLILKK